MLYTVIAESGADGGHLVSQLRSQRVAHVPSVWIQSHGSTLTSLAGAGEGRHLATRDIVDLPTPVAGLENVWCDVPPIDEFVMLTVAATEERESPSRSSKIRLFTYCALVAGGTYLDQISASGEAEANRAWASLEKQWVLPGGIPVQTPAADDLLRIGFDPIVGLVNVGQMMFTCKNAGVSRVYRIITPRQRIRGHQNPGTREFRGHNTD